MEHEWIAGRLAALCADATGAVPRGRVLLDRAARFALLIDLAFLDRLVVTDDQTEIDTTHTGVAPADEMLDYIELHPAASMSAGIEQASVTLGEVSLLADARPQSSVGRWGHAKRKIMIEPARIAAERARIADAAAGEPDSAATAALAQIAFALRIAFPETPALDLLEQCGPVAWLVRDGVTYLEVMYEQFARSNADAQAWQAANFFQ